MPSILDQLRPALSSPAGTALATKLVPSTPRRRAAVVVHDGYMVTDTLVKVRPTVFLAGLAGMAVSGFALWQRKHKGTEAIALYTAAFAASAAAAWFCRPGQTATPAGVPATKDNQMMAWLDRRAAALDQTEPGWEAVAMRRVVG